MIDRLDALEAEAARAMDAARDPAALEEARVRWLGRKSELTGILRGLKDLTPAERSSVGARANRARESLERRYDEIRGRLERDGAEHGRLSGPDLTLPGRAVPRGHTHLISQVLAEVREIFHGLGFALAEGPEVEDDHHNFGALNMPEGHPARAITDTFY